MAIDIIARGLAAQLIGPDGRVLSKKMPTLTGTSDLSGFTPIGHLTDASMVEGKTAEEILLTILYGVVNPTLTAPSVSITLNEGLDILIIGRESRVEGVLTFDRGKIDPAYGTSGYRAGLPTAYTINNETTAASDLTYNFSFVFTPTQSENTIVYSVSYEEGEQPLNSIGSAVGEPLAAGSIGGNITLTAVYPLLDANGADYEFTWFEANDGSGYLATFASEGSGIKQAFAVSSELTVIGVKGFNVLTQQWEWLGGNAERSLTHFDVSITDDGNVLYTHNQPATGKRELRIYVS